MEGVIEFVTEAFDPLGGVCERVGSCAVVDVECMVVSGDKFVGLD